MSFSVISTGWDRTQEKGEAAGPKHLLCLDSKGQLNCGGGGRASCSLHLGGGVVGGCEGAAEGASGAYGHICISIIITEIFVGDKMS